MSKSLGNFFTIREVFEQWGKRWNTDDPKRRDQWTGEVLRYFLLGTHYRSPLDFSDQSLQESKNALDGFYDVFVRLEEASPQDGPADGQIESLLAGFRDTFQRAMDDDFNTPSVLAEFQRLRAESNKLFMAGLSRRASGTLRDMFRSAGQVVGLFQLTDWQFNSPALRETQTHEIHALSDSTVQQRVDDRNEARRRKDFAKADAIRQELQAQGILIEDRPDGTSRWKR
jgi:cysteinyl-tRNA synthetase